MVQTSLQDWSDFESRELTGRNRRLLHEWRALDRAVEHRDGIDYWRVESPDLRFGV